MSLESNIFNWVTTIASNVPQDTTNINVSSGTTDYKNIGEAFRDLKQVIRDQSLSHGWGTLGQWKYFSNASDDATFLKFHGTLPNSGSTAATALLDWNVPAADSTTGADMIIQIKAGSLSSLGNANADATTRASLDFTPGTMFTAFAKDASSSNEWFTGYVQDTYIPGGSSSDIYIRVSGVYKYTSSALALDEADPGLLPVKDSTELNDLYKADSYIVFSAFALRLPSTLSGSHTSSRYNYSQKVVNWNGALPTNQYPATPVVTSNASYGTVATVPNVPSRRETGTFLMEGYNFNNASSLTDPTEMVGATAKIAVPFITPAVPSANFNPQEVPYPIFLTPIHVVTPVDRTVDLLCFQVKNIKRYATGFTVTFHAPLGEFQSILWQWLRIVDFN